MSRSLSRAAAIALLFSLAGARAQVTYPGPDPGPARASRSDSQLILSNTALSVSWQMGEGRFKLESIADGVSHAVNPLTSEAFEIVLTNGQHYAASTLKPDGACELSELRPSFAAARLAARGAGWQARLALSSSDGRLRVIWRAILGDGANYVRQEIEVTALGEDAPIQEISWLDQALPEAQTRGLVDGSPVVAGNFFLGSEDPHARNDGSATVPPNGGNRVRCRVPRNALLRRDETLTQSIVCGVAPPGQLRRAFLCYLERERAHPYRPYLHYNSWYDTAWDPFALNETNCLEAIRSCGERLIQPYGVVMDGMVFDDGWDNPKTLWQFHAGFPSGFKPLADLCREYHTHLGVWLSPFGGYGEPREQRLRFGREQGYEINSAGFSLAGPKYYAAFKNACVGMIRRFGVNHFKFDGIAAGMAANGGAEFTLDTEAMGRLMLELRREDPNLYINLTTGSWPSPFWLRYADSVWRQGGDMGHAGKGSLQQQWLTYRDQEVYHNIVRKGPLYPLNSLMTQGVAYSRHGMAGDPSFDSRGFKDDVRAFFGSGTGLQELYIQPGRLVTEDWRVLAEAAKWSRAHSGMLVDTHWIGGDPSKLEVYGYASWHAGRGAVMLRNPDDQSREYSLDIGQAFELPLGAARSYRLRSPWSEEAAQPVIQAEADKAVRFTLEPFQVLVLETL